MIQNDQISWTIAFLSPFLLKGMSEISHIIESRTAVFKSQTISSQWMLNIRGYYDINLRCYFPCHLSVSSQQEGEDWESLFQPATSLTLSKYTIIWCKIQLTINTFSSPLHHLPCRYPLFYICYCETISRKCGNIRY